MSNANGNSRKSPTPGEIHNGGVGGGSQNQGKRQLAPNPTSTTAGTAAGSATPATGQTAALSSTNSRSMTDDDNQNQNSDEREKKTRGRRIMHISSDEINVLVYRYLQEAGFVHSAFTFAYESMLGRSHTSKANVPPGALISFLQKGLQYVGIEETIRQDGSDVPMNGQTQEQQQDVDFTLLSPQSIQALTRKNPPIQINVPPSSAAAAIKAKLESEANASMRMVAVSSAVTNPSSVGIGGGGVVAGSGGGKGSVMQREVQERYRQQAMQARGLPSDVPWTTSGYSHGGGGAGTTTVAMNAANMAGGAVQQQQQQQQQQRMGHGMVSGLVDRQNILMNDNLNEQTKAAAVALASFNAQGLNTLNKDNKASKSVTKDVAVAPSLPLQPPSTAQSDGNISNDIEMEDLLTRAKPHEVLQLNKHTSEVFMCAWNPIYTDLLATGSGDASARIWKMAGKDAQKGSDVCRLLQHGTTNASDQKNKDVTTLEWSSNGELLATGSYDGVARVWSRTGALVHTLHGHIGPIFSLKWNKSGNYLLSGSYDKTTIVWDVSGETGNVKQQFMYHTAPALDVDWKDDLTFASCSTDKTVLICKVGMNHPLHRFKGHKDEVNAVKWDPSGSLLASCSDDYTAKVWDLSRGNSNPLYDFRSHQQEIYTVKWSPTGPGSKNPEKPRMLATASFDSTVRLWSVDNGSCLAVLSRHKESVYSVAFSPSGDYLASGSLAGQLYVWRLKDGKQIKNFKGNGDIFEVAWNKEETRIAACFSSNVVNVIDFKRE